MEIRAAYGCPSDSYDDILGLCDGGYGGIDHAHVLVSKPRQGPHPGAIRRGFIFWVNFCLDSSEVLKLQQKVIKMAFRNKLK